MNSQRFAADLDDLMNDLQEASLEQPVNGFFVPEIATQRALNALHALRGRGDKWITDNAFRITCNLNAGLKCYDDRPEVFRGYVSGAIGELAAVVARAGKEVGV